MEKEAIADLAKRYMQLTMDFDSLFVEVNKLERPQFFEFLRLIVAQLREKKIPEEQIETMLKAAYWAEHQGKETTEKLLQEILQSPNILLSPEP